MGDAIPPPAARAGVSFELERLEHEDGKLVVSGHWTGLRGVRFVRPTLVVGERNVLATLEHKPWAPRSDRAWTAAFPWKGRTPDAADLELAVAPSISVALGPPSDDGPGPPLTLVPDAPPVAETAPPPDEPAPVPDPAPPPDEPSPRIAPVAVGADHGAAANDRMRLRLVERELEDLLVQREALSRELERVRAELADAAALAATATAERADVEAGLRRERRAADEAGASRDELQRARTAAERDRDIARAQRDEAVTDREAAVRTRARMELACEEAVAAKAEAEAALHRALAARDEAQAQRDEVLLAYRGLQRHVHSERAGLDRAERGDTAATDPEEPLGVRRLPAARTVMAELQRPAPASKFVVSKFDVWVVRVLGSVAAGCFILLLISIIRVFM